MNEAKAALQKAAYQIKIRLLPDFFIPGRPTPDAGHRAFGDFVTICNSFFMKSLEN